MCCASVHLLIGALLVFAVENEATTMIPSTENTTAPVSVSTDNTTLFNKTNFTTPNFTVHLPNTTDAKTTSDGESESSTPPPPEHPQTNKYTTDDPLKTVSQTRTNTMSKTTTSKTIITQAPTPGKNQRGSISTAYIIILIIAVLCLSGVVVYCCLKKTSRKYSVDLHPKQEDARIPLSTVDVEVFDTTSVKDMHTFTPGESPEALTDPAPVKEAEKPEGGKETADVKQENQQNSSSTQATENPKDKMDGLTIVDLTDGEPTVSTKTSMESLDDVLNENNSNNTRAEADERPSSAFQYMMPHDL